MALLELTVNTHIILPGMLTVTVAVMTTRHTFGCRSVFLMLLQARGLDYSNDPVTQSLRRAGVTSIMNTSLVRLSLRLSRHEAKEHLASKPLWSVMWDDSQEFPVVLRSADLVRVMESEQTETIELMEIPAERTQCECIDHRLNLQQALDKMLESQTRMLCVTRDSHRFPRRLDSVIGVITRDMIETYYQYP
jgi:CIC family chloride channel protein